MDTGTKVEELAEPHLHHVWTEPIEKFFLRVDKFGGWPLDKKYVCFFHSFEPFGRKCEFGNEPLRTEWWTVVCSVDEYLWWKLSPAFKCSRFQDYRQHLSIVEKPGVENMWNDKNKSC